MVNSSPGFYGKWDRLTISYARLGCFTRWQMSQCDTYFLIFLPKVFRWNVCEIWCTHVSVPWCPDSVCTYSMTRYSRLLRSIALQYGCVLSSLQSRTLFLIMYLSLYLVGSSSNCSRIFMRTGSESWCSDKFPRSFNKVLSTPKSILATKNSLSLLESRLPWSSPTGFLLRISAKSC
jgi:hypothetical protein